MAKLIHTGKRKALKAIAQEARAGRLSHVMKPEYLAQVKKLQAEMA